LGAEELDVGVPSKLTDGFGEKAGTDDEGVGHYDEEGG